VIEVHPVAALFPMLAADELAALADDISERGLLQPIVLDAEGRILDGRNRLAACELAEVEPTFTTYEGGDPAGYALAVNIARRQMTKGQIAVVAARARKLNGQSQPEAAYFSKISQSMIAYADVILPHKDLADQVRDGPLSLNEAYAEARQRNQAKADREAGLAVLREDAPDLAELVAEDRLSIADALSMLDARLSKQQQEVLERARKREEDRRDATRLLVRLVDLAVSPGVDGLDEYIDSWAEKVEFDQVDGKRLSQAATILAEMGKRWTSSNT
jgi:hypothetical protein